MQKLNFEQIKKLVHGVSRVEEGDNAISFFRFTKKQQELYKSLSPTDFYFKTFATSGITLEFETDSENLSLEVLVSRGSSRTFFTHSIFVNGKKYDELSGDIGDKENVSFKKAFALGGGLKTIKILFPWSVCSRLVSLELDDNSKIIPIKKDCKILMFGDSITQGYDAMLPENAYAVNVATKLNAEALNKGIAGEQFLAKLTEEKENFEPDIITVAYGTNDWRHSTKAKFEKECKGFFANLRNNYPTAKIYVITPIWRADIDNKQEFGEPLSFVGEYITKVCAELSDVNVINGIDLVPHNTEYYQTDGVHPIDSGFKLYAKSLLENTAFGGFSKK